jgi:hypothetical protein
MAIHRIPIQRSLFKIPIGPSAVLFSLSDESFLLFLSLLRSERPSAVIDLRVSPRFDFDDFDRQRVLSYLSSLGIPYIDPALDSAVEVQRGREIEAVATANLDSKSGRLVILLTSAGASVGGVLRRALASAGISRAVVEMP